MNQLCNFAKIQNVGDLVALASNTDSNSTRLDMSGYEGVVFIAKITDSVATGVAKLSIEQNSADSDTGMKGLTGAYATATCAANDDLNGGLLIVDCQPTKRYVQGVRTSATANIAFGDIIAIQYGKKGVLPITQATSVLAIAKVFQPNEVA